MLESSRRGAWGYDDIVSKCVDAGDPAADYSLEPEPNGGRANLGVYGNTVQASKTFVPGTIMIIR